MPAMIEDWKETKQNLERAARGNQMADRYVAKFGDRDHLAHEADAIRMIADLMHWMAARHEWAERAVEEAVSRFTQEAEGRRSTAKSKTKSKRRSR